MRFAKQIARSQPQSLVARFSWAKPGFLLKPIWLLLMFGFHQTQLDSIAAPSSGGAVESPQELTEVFRDRNPPSQATTRSGFSLQTLLIALFVATAFPLGQAVYLIRRRLNSLISARASAANHAADIVAEDPTVAEFFRELRDALNPAPDATSESPKNVQTCETELEAAPDPLQEFFASVPSRIGKLRKLLSEVHHADRAASQQALLEFLNLVSSLKDGSRPSELRPLWLLACALEGLLKQLSKNAAEVTHSVLGTVAGAVDLLEALAVRGLDPELATEPPVKLLAVDDDPVSRLAISFALKKAFNAPDLAPDGQTALDLIARHSYDVIFLDVAMPGMDGYELCMKIRQNKDHQTTPVVFVTRHDDFQSRAKSTLSGGHALIGKPFLAFEITVKALTLALRRRLQNRKAVATPECQGETMPAAATIAPEQAETPAAETTNPTAEKSSWAISNRGFQALFSSSGVDSSDSFLTHAPRYLGQLRDKLQAAQQATTPADLQKLLGQMYVDIHALSAEAERAELHTISRLSSALEGMLKKLLDRPNLCTPSTLNAAAAALELLEVLYGQTGDQPSLANPPGRILVVDDDPVARRAISMAVQLVFGRPDNAESGEAAVALADEKAFDLIFLDVLMPGINGFAACKRIHESGLNRRTPVVFITSHDDTEARSKAVDAGGCGFIPKPVLSSQITLIALTFILRARLSLNTTPTEAIEAAACS